MAEVILHHYPTSPFAEKIRALLGAKSIAWRSVVIPQIMPKPDVIALTGGYRKTPVLQIGADIYCDTTRIAQELERIAPKPALLPETHAATAARFAQWCDTTLFQVAVGLVFQPAVIAKSFPGPPENLQAFIADRMAMREGSTVRRIPADEAQATLTVFLGELEAQLRDGRKHLLGDAPTIADFSAYHPLWFVSRVDQAAADIAAKPAVAQWLASMRGLADPAPAELPSEQAVAIAAAATPSTLAPSSDTAGLSVGDLVEVGATDYGLEVTTGELVRLSTDEIAVRRTDPRAGEVIVHFPRISYQVRRAT